jgi:DivIVA domain-containing protein
MVAPSHPTPQTLRGYNTGDVDHFLQGLSRRLRSGQTVSAREIGAVKFRQTLRGYNIGDVDAYLTRLAATVGTPE